MTSYFIVDTNNIRRYSGAFSETRAFAEELCASSLDTVLYQIRFRGSEVLGQFVYEYTSSGHRQVLPRRYIYKSEIKKVTASGEAMYV
jgi:hypothetical protein